MRYDNSVKKLVLKKFQSKIGICSIAKDFGIDRGTIRIWKNLFNQDLESNKNWQ